MTHLSLFSGVGGIDLSAHWAGFTTVQFVERDPFCQRVLTKNFKGVPIHDDVTTFDAKPFRGRTTLLSGGVPCQDISAANKYSVGFSGNRSGLVSEFFRISVESRATWLLFENSPRAITTYGHELLPLFGEHGYDAEPVILSNPSFHERKRGFVVAHAHSVGSKEKVQRVARLALDAQRFSEAQEQAGVNFILRHDADPVFAFEHEGRCLVAPVFCRATNGVPNRVDRVGALGNAVSPMQVYPILRAIAETL